MSDRMSEAGNATPKAGTPVVVPTFNERENTILACAWRSLKTGPPEIDYEKLAGLVGMTNPGSARNAWAKIKVKLLADNNIDEGAAPIPKKGSPKKKALSKVKEEGDAEDNGDGEAPATPKKTPRKRAPKKQEVDGEENASPKKRGRPAKAKAAEVIKTEAEVEDNIDDSGNLKDAGAEVDAMDETVDEV